MPAISPARKAAFRILLAVERGQTHADDLLRADEVSALATADRNLATALVLGVLRWQIWLDGQIRPLLKRPNAKLDPEVLIALRLGVFQLSFLDRVPDHAAIDESVELTKQSGHRFAAGMVNAVLRSIACSSLLEDSRGKLAAVEANSAWMVERWTNLYGPEAMQAICRHGQSQPRLNLRMENPAVQDELSEAGIELAPGELLTAARTVVSGDVTATVAFREGRARVQDEGSQLIGESGRVSRRRFRPKPERDSRCLRCARRQDAHPCGTKFPCADCRLRIEPAAACRIAQAPRRIRRPRGVPISRRS